MPKKKKKSSKGPRTVTGSEPLSNRCSYCNQESQSLKICSRCGFCAYCSRDCQRAAYKEHKQWCKQTAADFPRDDTVAMKRILFSRCFGGAVSLYMKHHSGQRGLIHAKCSHKFTDYCERRRSEEKRSIELTFVPEGEQLLALQEASLGDSQAKKDEEGPGWLESALECNDSIVHISSTGTGQDNLEERFIIVALEQPERKFLHTFVFFTYLSPDHPAHEQFEQVLGDPRGAAFSNQAKLDWDWNPAASQPASASDAPLDWLVQWLFYNSIGSQFYQQCSLAWQQKERSKDPSPWPGGVMTPPMCLKLNMSTGSIDSSQPYQLQIST